MENIGGYIQLEYSRGEEYHKEALALNSGRFCLEYLIKSRKILKLYLPSYLCDSIKKICEKLFCKYEYYPIDSNFRPNFQGELKKNEYLYIVNYYGLLQDSEIKLLKQKYPKLILDNAHAFFKLPISGIDTIYTCRKFLGVPDGGYLYTDSLYKEKLGTDKSYKRMDYILGRFEEDATLFYKNYIFHENQFEMDELKKMSLLTHNLLRNIDYDYVSRIRRNNFEFLHKRLMDINLLKINSQEVPYMYPLYIQNGKLLRTKLINKRVFIPQLWPNVLTSTNQDSIEYQFAENILPLPCDQRYGKREMNVICDLIYEYLKK